MLRIVQVEGWGVCLGFFFVLMCVVVGKWVTKEREQGVQVPREHIHCSAPTGSDTW